MATYNGIDKRLQYLFEHGGGGGNANMWTGTQAEYAQQASQIEDGTLVNITDDEGVADSWHVYSTDEKLVGKWIDGSDIYEKTFTGLSISINGYSWVYWTGVTNIAQLINLHAYSSSGMTIGVAEYSKSSTGGVQMTGIPNTNNRTIGILVLQYVKASS